MIYYKHKRKENIMNYNREKFQTIESFEKEFDIHFTMKHNGKMSGMVSLSTSPMKNTFCQNRSKCNGTICQKCYAMRMSKMYSKLEKRLVKNFEVLTSQIIPVEKMPLLNVLKFRFESFGDVQNEIQIINYFNLCKKNPNVQFTIWTKNMSIFAKLFQNGYNGIKYNKPKNLIIIISSPFVNKAVNIKDYKFADKVFTVYSKEYAKENGVVANCHRMSCMVCQKCYNKKDKTVYINELLK